MIYNVSIIKKESGMEIIIKPVKQTDGSQNYNLVLTDENGGKVEIETVGSSSSAEDLADRLQRMIETHTNDAVWIKHIA